MPMLDRLPIFPLGTVLFPGGLLPLKIFEPRYMDMARECLRAKAPFGVCRIVEGKEVGEPAIPDAIGTLASILECDMEQLGILTVRTAGGDRFRIHNRWVEGNGLVVATVETLEDEPDAPVPEHLQLSADVLKRIVGEYGAQVFLEPYRFDSASWVGRRLSEVLPISTGAKQKLLELDDAVARLEVVQRYLEQRGAFNRK